MRNNSVQNPRKSLKTAFSLFLIAVLVANLVLFVRLKNQVLFWGVIIAAAVIAYYVMPKIKS